MKSTSLLFVYGTLKRGFHNHYYIADKTTYLHPFSLDGFQMYLDKSLDEECRQLRTFAKTSFDPWPYLKYGKGSVSGELYQINEMDVLVSIDQLEGADDNFYQRELISTVVGDCFLYIYLPELSSEAQEIRTFTLQDQGLYQGDET
jgi:gamma-glutamylcyclotransferase (GGCT)/AIG2-like uncharacterized protein YtfP